MVNIKKMIEKMKSKVSVKDLEVLLEGKDPVTRKLMVDAYQLGVNNTTAIFVRDTLDKTLE